MEYVNETAGSGTIDHIVSMIKVDQMNEEMLKNISVEFNKNETYDFVVRPWIEHDYGRKFCINDISQFALYKCMYEKCIFATNSAEKWQMHMAIHLQLIEYFKQKNCLFKGNRDRLIKFRECPYCGFEAKADHEMIRHMDEEHRRGIFQCPSCFYRTMEMDTVVRHIEHFHPNDRPKQIFLCGNTRDFSQQDEEIMYQDCDVYVQKIVCGQCKLNFFFNLK